MSELIVAALRCSNARGELLERYRGYLRVVAEQEIGVHLRRRVEASDLVQETFVKAEREFSKFRGTAEPQFSAWISQILRNIINDAVRGHVQAEKRAVGRERSFSDSEQSAALSWNQPAAVESTPSQKVIRGERAVRLAQIIDSLPDGQRIAVQRRYIEGQSLDQIADEIGRSVSATAGLIKRGLAALRTKMSQRSWC